MDSGRCRQAAKAARVSAALHLGAIVGMVMILRQGLPPGKLAERWDFVCFHREAWTIAWVAWMVAAVSATVAFGLMARALGRGRAAVLLFAAGNMPDLYGLWLYITVPFASGCPDELLRMDRSGAFLNGALANGLYTVAWAVLVWQARGLHRGLDRLAVAGVAAIGRAHV